jgi:hypothetical protein
MKRFSAAPAIAGAGLVLCTGFARAGITASSVIDYTPGDFTDFPSDSSYTNSTAAIGPLTGDTTYGGLNPFNPPFTSDQIVAVGAGGQLTLQLSAPMSTSGGTSLGVFSNNGIVDYSADGSGLAGNPSTTFDDPDHPEAIVSVSSDGIHYVQLNGGNPITFSNPTNYYLDQEISGYYQNLGSVVANQFLPFTGTLASFNGETYDQIKATLNGSAGGTWLDLSGTGLTTVNDVRFTVPSDADYNFVVDSVSASPPNLTWNNGATGTATAWDTTHANWNNGTANVAFTSSGENVSFIDNAGGHYVVNVNTAVTPGAININTTGSYTFSGTGSIGGGGGLTINGGTVTISNTGPNAFGSTTLYAGTLYLSSTGALPVNQGLVIASGATVIATSHTGGPDNINVLQVSTLANQGTLDLTNNSMVIQPGADIGSITAQVQAAFNGGAWNGTSTGGVITSSTAANDSTHLTAIGIATGLTSFDGLTVDPGDILLKYTYYGDANLDGSVDGSDYTLIDAGYNADQGYLAANPGGTALPATGWQNGDFNYDGVVDGSDYTLIDNGFNTQGANLGATSGDLIAASTEQIAGNNSAVPEPATFGMFGMAAAGVLARRKRR